MRPPDFTYDWDRIRASVTSRTRLIIFNTPNNPACTAATGADLDELAAITRDSGILVLSDEVYEHVVFDGLRHHSVTAHPELRERSFAVFSFGKTLHATGMRVGYAIAPPALTRELRKVHQYNTYSISHAAQYAIARYLIEKPNSWTALADFFQTKRDRLRAALEGSAFELPPAQGTYFQLLDFSRMAPPGDTLFAERLLTEVKLATIPLTPFYKEPPPLGVVRLCIAKRDATLDAAAARLRSFRP
jgi:methionine aminotransferase